MFCTSLVTCSEFVTVYGRRRSGGRKKRSQWIQQTTWDNHPPEGGEVSNRAAHEMSLRKGSEPAFQADVPLVDIVFSSPRVELLTGRWRAERTDPRTRCEQAPPVVSRPFNQLQRFKLLVLIHVPSHCENF